jgi:hypothetical protein
MIEIDQTVRVGIRERVKQNPVDHGKNRSVGADGKRQRQDGGYREAGRPAKAASCMDDVAPGVLHRTPPPHLSSFLFYASAVTEADLIALCCSHFLMECKLRFEILFEVSPTNQLQE